MADLETEGFSQQTSFYVFFLLQKPSIKIVHTFVLRKEILSYNEFDPEIHDPGK